ncbi:3-hydroxyacyl-[acyl-carrier-protein] dehydratase [Halospina denitrificans]|uniref:3-hydroxyacyl-[acyl-carrier-protein] dehydratase FabZ n=1 Tax=Halospina denitrificans TaxID=332522 RepID=A0A4R7JZV8_9GAMM|nr:3-hydroxyacyl-ACP dehydratase FabZ [Halospina denitrificans]TDT43187.1 3-hydroxyacyl-[acyl-carrier-protein] dehydratase [Halospina denitrificans]
MNIEEIMEFLPHRYPFLLVDRVTDVEKGEYIVGLKNVSINEHYFEGHFPQKRIMPGVMIIESMAQLSGVLGFVTVGRSPADGFTHYFAGCNKARFKRQVVPGDQLVIRSTLLADKHNIWKFDCKAWVGDDLACAAEIITAEGAI